MAVEHLQSAIDVPTIIGDDELQPVGLGAHFKITRNGLLVVGDPSFEDFDALGETLRTLDKATEFAIGDYFLEVERRLGEAASQLLDHRAWSEETKRNYRWISEKIPQAIRRLDVLTISHHQKVARLPPAQQEKWLKRAAAGDEKDGVRTPWTVSRLQKAVKAGEDPQVTKWVAVVYCTSERKRDEIVKELEGRGYECKASERRGDK